MCFQSLSDNWCVRDAAALSDCVCPCTLDHCNVCSHPQGGLLFRSSISMAVHIVGIIVCSTCNFFLSILFRQLVASIPSLASLQWNVAASRTSAMAGGSTRLHGAGRPRRCLANVGTGHARMGPINWAASMASPPGKGHIYVWPWEPWAGKFPHITAVTCTGASCGVLHPCI